MKKDLFFKLHEGCYIVKGLKGACIYNLIEKDVYSIDIKLANILQYEINGNMQKLSQEAKSLGVKENELFKALKRLTNLRLGNFYENNIYIEKMKSSLSKEIIKKSDSSKLMFLWCEIIGDCNLDCIHCVPEFFIFNCRFCKKHNTNKFKIGSLSLKDWKCILEDAAAFKCNSLRIMGGEPLLMGEDIVDILSSSLNLGYINIELYTNGTLLTDRIIDCLKNLNINLIITLYSKNSNIHDSITRVKGSHEIVMNNIQKLQKRSLKFKIFLPILKQNQNSLEETIEFYQSLGIEIIYDFIKYDTRIWGLEFIPDKAIPFLFRGEPIFKQIDLNKFYKIKDWNLCWAFNAAITFNGDVIPCIRARDEVVGNIKESSLREILIEERLKNYWELSKDKIPVCKDCEFRYACEDCRIVAKALNNSFESKDFFCLYNPYEKEWDKKALNDKLSYLQF